jgi:hypothetical protein
LWSRTDGQPIVDMAHIRAVTPAGPIPGASTAAIVCSAFSTLGQQDLHDRLSPPEHTSGTVIERSPGATVPRMSLRDNTVPSVLEAQRRSSRATVVLDVSRCRSLIEISAGSGLGRKSSLE